MRSPLRIPGFLRGFQNVWEMCPDQRFGQLVMNLTRNGNGEFEDPWNWEDSEWNRRLVAYRDATYEDSAAVVSPDAGGTFLRVAQAAGAPRDAGATQSSRCSGGHHYRRIAERVLASRQATSDEYDLARAVLDLLDARALSPTSRAEESHDS